MAYIPHTPRDVEEMLRTIGADSLDDLFRDVPSSLLLDKPLDLPQYSEFEVLRFFEDRAAENKTYPAGKLFMGAGAYRHFIPSVCAYICSRGEFMTSYTPYQAEVSQGTLQAIFEFQSHICALTGLEVANASMYDGATALAEALSMAVRDKRKNLVYIPELLLPKWKQVCETFLREVDIEIRYIPARGASTDYFAIEPDAASAVVVGVPNGLGGIEDAAAARQMADKAGALLVAAANPTALMVLAPPAEFGADIAVGESQPLGIPLGFGGPYAGFLACTKKLIRRMPGRIVGQTRDKSGKEGFVLTLQTREQHIRRDKATSNICTNQGLYALMVTVYLTALGREGLTEVAETSLLRTQQLADALVRAGAELFDPETPFFHEAALKLPCGAEDFYTTMKKEHGILAGVPMSRLFPEIPGSESVILVNCTEVITPEDIAEYADAAASALDKLSEKAAVHS